MAGELTDSFDVCDMLSPDHTALSVAVSIKALDEDGEVCVVNARSSDLTPWEAIGMLTMHLDDLRARCRQRAEDDD